MHKYYASRVLFIILFLIIKIECEEEVIQKETIEELASAVRKNVISGTWINEVMVYANTSQIKVSVDPVEIFIEMSANKVKDRDALTESIKNKLISWKNEQNIIIPFNLTLTPVDWNLAIGF